MLNIPDSKFPRIVIVGAGFAGFNLAKKLSRKNFQVVLIDKYNYHQFQPLFYQVAMAGLEPQSIIYPLRKAFQNNKNVYIRICEVESIDSQNKKVDTDLGRIYYDKLVLACGATTNFFGNKELEERTLSLKSLSESLRLRNTILYDLEHALMTPDYKKRQGYIDIVIVGGGATGVELAGAMAEMKRYILPKDYPELDENEVDIHLIHGGPRLLMGMSQKSSDKALAFLKKLGVNVYLEKRVISFDGKIVHTEDGDTFKAHKVIWAAGITGVRIDGLPDGIFKKANRIKVNRYHEVEGINDIYALGDISFMTTEDYPEGHPQVAQVALQHSNNLAKIFIKEKKYKFSYKDYGSMATVGRNRAVADISKLNFSGFIAWLLWLFVHLMALVGFKNKIFVLLNWTWNYMTYDQSLRVIINSAKEFEPRNERPIDQ